MNLFDWLFRPHRKPNRVSVGIPLTNDDPEELHILAEPRHRPPKRGRRRTPEEIAADHQAFLVDYRRKSKASFDLTKRRALQTRSTHYRWRTAGDTDVCPTCKRMAGKKVGWDDDVEAGHPGLCTACPSGYCRCYAEPIIPRY